MKVFSPVKGKVKDVKFANDKVFAEYMMGIGFFVISNDTKVKSPIDGTISFIASTKHAIVIENGDINVMVHVGLDTCALKGKAFDILFEEGDKVHSGDTLMLVNRDLIKENGLNDDVFVIIVENNNKELLDHLPEYVSEGDAVMEV